MSDENLARAIYAREECEAEFSKVVERELGMTKEQAWSYLDLLDGSKFDLLPFEFEAVNGIAGWICPWYRAFEDKTYWNYNCSNCEYKYHGECPYTHSRYFNRLRRAYRYFSRMVEKIRDDQ